VRPHKEKHERLSTKAKIFSMDEEQANNKAGAAGYRQVAVNTDDDDDLLQTLSNAINATDDENDSDEFQGTNEHDADEFTTGGSISLSSSSNTFSWKDCVERVLNSNFLPDHCTCSIGSNSTTELHFVEGPFTVKLIKLIVLTFGMIAVMHWIVPHISNDRDKSLRLWHIWVFEGNLIVADMIIFFLVGRLWRQKGVDNLAFLGWAFICNVYFQSQPYIKFLQHSVSLFEMHCGT
jgi:hypothetical protein